MTDAVLQLGGFGVQRVEREGFEGFGEAERVDGRGLCGHSWDAWMIMVGLVGCREL